MVTLKDVAEKAEVTVTTVSRVINNRGYLSEQTRKKVYDAMKAFDYHPNSILKCVKVTAFQGLFCAAEM